MRSGVDRIDHIIRPGRTLQNVVDDRLTQCGQSGKFFLREDDDCRLAARVIRTLLRHVSPSDVFNVYGTEGGVDG